MATVTPDEPVNTLSASPDTRSGRTTRRSLEFAKMEVETSANEVVKSKASNMDSSAQKTTQEDDPTIIDETQSKLVRTLRQRLTGSLYWPKPID